MREPIKWEWEQREFFFSFSLLVDQGERTEFRSRVIAAAPSQFLSSHGIAAAAVATTTAAAAPRRTAQFATPHYATR